MPNPVNAVTITLSLPPMALHPNARVHWAVKAKATKRYRYAAYMLTLVDQGGLSNRWERATGQATFYFKDARRRDKDNSAAALKAAWDGMVDAGLLVNDSGLTPLPPIFAIDKARPRVEITVTEDCPRLATMCENPDGTIRVCKP